MFMEEGETYEVFSFGVVDDIIIEGVVPIDTMIEMLHEYRGDGYRYVTCSNKDEAIELRKYYGH